MGAHWLVATGCIRGVGITTGNKVDCCGHLGAESPADHTRRARLFRGVEEEANTVPAVRCECGDAGIREMPRIGEFGAFDGIKASESVVYFARGWLGEVGPPFPLLVNVHARTDEPGSEEGIDGDKVGWFVEDGAGEGAYDELGTDEGGKIADGMTCGGMVGVDAASGVDIVLIYVSGRREADVEGACSGQTTQSEHENKNEEGGFY